tara:strand:+ start:3685 stop:5916 length:2232 start_codon:yes stop_codon:yes gene_type:complete
MDDKFLKPYDPNTTENEIYNKWEESGFFNPDECIQAGITEKDARPFSIILPPPNVTGNLHMGHAVMLALQDIMIRYNRMSGKRTLWLPGTDHAAIATQSKVEKELYKKEKKTRHDLGRDEFIARVEAFAKESHDTIVNQIKKIGASVDWSREAFTLDENRSLAVRTAFKNMYDDGLIYRGSRIVNWDPKMQTTVSDDEIEWKEEKATFYYLKYGPFTIGTARPETKFGDKYVVMHPDDSRYKEYTHGQTLEVEWINGLITATVIKDEAVDMEFGTGVMTITPWHDATDFDIAERHKLDKEQIIDFKGKLLPIAEEFEGIHISKARPEIVKKLEEKGLLERVDENYTHRIATNSRGNGVIEPQIKEQWFVDVNKEFRGTTLKKEMRDAVEGGKITIIPDHFKKTYFHWIDNLRDWCISRQIWYGHRIPVWYKGSEVYVGVEEPGGDGWKQDLDTLDTWFSSGLWTFSTLGWPFDYGHSAELSRSPQGKPIFDDTQGKPVPGSDLDVYHPTAVLETGYDILFFWVARMILMSSYHLDDIPFKTVYLHGLVRDEKGQKMSKSLGNVIDPLDMTEKYGADATRLSLIIGATAGTDVKLSEDKVRGYKHFSNKLWNITRFVLSNTEGLDSTSQPPLTKEDTKILEESNTFAKEVTEAIERFQLHLAGEKLYQYVWHTFADKIIEESKPILEGDDEKAKKSRQYTLYTILVLNIKLLHPFTPFVTEEIWSSLPHHKENMLLVEKWPVDA